jgi:predicted transposase YdaD
MDEQERRIYEKYIINTVRDRDALNTAKAEGLKEGLKEGEIKGKMEGLKEGEIKGKMEGLKEGEIKGKIEVAINALKSGLPVSMISSLTGLTEQEIEKLR